MLLRWSKRGPDDFAEAMVSLFPSAVWHQPSVVHDWCLALPHVSASWPLVLKRSGIAIRVGSTLVSSGSLIICENETEYDEPGVPFSCVDSDADSCSVLTDECEPRLHAWCMNSILLLLGIYLSETIWPNFGSTGVNVSRFTSELSSGAHVCAVPGPIVHGSLGWVQQDTEPYFYTFLMLFSKGTLNIRDVPSSSLLHRDSLIFSIHFNILNINLAKLKFI